MLTHTPGPWECGTLGDGGRVNVYRDSTMDVRICRVDSGQDIGIDAMSNARLIAAAPDLLEALQGLYADQVDYLTLNHLGGMDNHWMVAARAAISKATGAA